MKIGDFRVGRSAAALLVVAIFACLYLDAGLAVGSFRVPSATALLLILLLPGRVRALRLSLLPILAFTAVAGISFFAGSERTPTDKAFSSWVQTVWCIYIASLTFNFLVRRELHALRTGALVIAVSLLALGALEVAGVLEAASRSFGEFAYGQGVGFNYYGAQTFALERDLALAGFRRPTVFSPEPSTAALGLTVAMMTVYFLASTGRAAVWCALSLVAAYSFFRSPTVLVGSVAIIGHAALTHRGTKVWSLSLLVLLIGVAGYFAEERISKLSLDPEMMLSTSEGLRLVLPFFNAWNSIVQGRVLGAGPGAQYDSTLIAGINPTGSDQFGTNIIALLLLYYGPIFLVLLVAIYYRSFKKMGFPKSASMGLVVSALLLGFSIGAIESARALGFLSFLAAALAVQKKSASYV